MTLTIIKVSVQVLFLTVLLYRTYMELAQNMSGQFVKSAITYVVVYLISTIANLDVLADLLRQMLVPYAVFLCVLYQPELRRSFAPGFSSRKRFFRFGGSHQTSVENVDSILSACQRLAQVRRGALIVFPRKVPIKNIIETGTKINADISSALIATVFDHDTPLHDGAMIIQGPKIIAAGCYLPLSAQTDISQSFGTRHRAALGMAEESDAVVIIVSEETSAISLAYNGNIYYNLDLDIIKNTLIALFNDVDIQLDSVEGSYEA